MITLDDSLCQFRVAETRDRPVYTVRKAHPMECSDSTSLTFSYKPSGIIAVILNGRILAECPPFSHYHWSSQRHKILLKVIEHLAHLSFHSPKIIYHWI